MSEPVDEGGETGRPVVGDRAGTPRWVKVSLIIAAVLVLVVAVALLFGGDHGPGRHPAPQGSGDASVAEYR